MPTRAALALSLSIEPSLVQDNLPSEVIPRVYIGSVHSAFNSDALSERGITHILNATGVPPTFPRLFTYLTLSLHDKETANLLACIPAATIFIDSALQEGGGVLVHCAGGRSRSAALLTAYLMSQQGLSFEEALGLIRAARPVVQLNKGFENQLRAYGEQGCDIYAAHQQLLRQRLQALVETRFAALGGETTPVGGVSGTSRNITMPRVSSTETFFTLAEKDGADGGWNSGNNSSSGRAKKAMMTLPSPLPSPTPSSQMPCLPPPPRAGTKAGGTAAVAWDSMGEEELFGLQSGRNSMSNTPSHHPQHQLHHMDPLLPSTAAAAAATAAAEGGGVDRAVCDGLATSMISADGGMLPVMTTRAVDMNRAGMHLPTIVMSCAEEKQGEYGRQRQQHQQQQQEGSSFLPSLIRMDMSSMTTTTTTKTTPTSSSSIQAMNAQRLSPYSRDAHLTYSGSSGSSSSSRIRSGRRPRPGPLKGFGPTTGDAPSLISTSSRSSRTSSGPKITSNSSNRHCFPSNTPTSAVRMPGPTEDPAGRAKKRPTTPQLRLTRPATSTTVQCIPHLQAFERGFHCRACSTRLFTLGNVLVLEKGGEGKQHGQGQQQQDLQEQWYFSSQPLAVPGQQQDPRTVIHGWREEEGEEEEEIPLGMGDGEEEEEEEEEEAEEVVEDDDDNMGEDDLNVDEREVGDDVVEQFGGDRMQEDLAEAEQQQQQQQQPQQQQQQQQRLHSSLPPLPYMSSLALGEAAAAATAVVHVGRGTQTHCRPTRLPSPLAGTRTPASPHPPPAPSHHRFMYSSNGVDILHTAPWLTSPPGSVGSLTPMHAMAATTSTTTTTTGSSSSPYSSGGPMNLPVLVHPGAAFGNPNNYSYNYGYDQSAQSTPRSCGSGVYRPPSSEQMQWLACMRALEEPGGTGERAQEAIKADVAACHRARIYHKRWILVERLPWMEETVVLEEAGVLRCPAPECQTEVGRWDWKENVAVGVTSSSDKGHVKGEGSEQQGSGRVAPSPIPAAAAPSPFFLPFFGFDKSKVVVAPPPLGSVGSSSGLSMSLSLSQSRLGLGNGDGSQPPTPPTAATCAMSSAKPFLRDAKTKPIL